MSDVAGLFIFAGLVGVGFSIGHGLCAIGSGLSDIARALQARKEGERK